MGALGQRRGTIGGDGVPSSHVLAFLLFRLKAGLLMGVGLGLGQRQKLESAIARLFGLVPGACGIGPIRGHARTRHYRGSPASTQPPRQ
jgi:hypothetical protein